MKFYIKIEVEANDITEAVTPEAIAKGLVISPTQSQLAILYKPKLLNEWPVWAKALKAVSKPEDKGLGDVVERIIGHENSDKFKSWYQKTFGKPCNCNGRKAWLNRTYPLP